MNIFDYLIIAAVLVAVGFAIRRVVLNRKQGKGCGGNCAGCGLNCPHKKL